MLGLGLGLPALAAWQALKGWPAPSAGELTADDGTTLLYADDGSTVLTED